MSWRAWLRWSRIHTAALTMPTALIGYLLAGGPLLSWGALSWLMFGLGFHFVGFTDNNNCDYKYDVNDPHKDHFPLGKEVPIAAARAITFASGFLLFAYGTFLAGSLEAWFVFLSMYAFGLLYNRISKESYLAGVWIAMTFGPMALFSYLSTTGGTYGPVILLVTAYGILQAYFQNAVSGSMKDIGSDPSRTNLFRGLGVTLSTPHGHMMMVPWRARGFALGVKALGAFPLAYLVAMALQLVPWMSSLLWAYAVYFTWQMMETQTWDNRKLVKRAALIEVLTFYALVVVLAPAITYATAAFIIVFSLAWYVSFNYVMWEGRLITPRV